MSSHKHLHTLIVIVLSAHQLLADGECEMFGQFELKV